MNAVTQINPMQGAPQLWQRARRMVSDRLARNWVMDGIPSRAAAPLVSFTFDDFPRSAAGNGAPILAEFGVKATYFVSGGRASRHLDDLDQFTPDDLIAVAGAGHEIGCHTFGHIRLPGMERTAIESDLAHNADFVRSLLGPYELVSFAYPFGDVSIAAKKLLGGRFPHCRGIFPGINKGLIDFMQLKAAPLERRSYNRAEIASLIDACAASNGWLIFFSHDVSDDPGPYGITPSDLADVLGMVKTRGISVLPVRDAAREVHSAAATPESAGAPLAAE